MRSKGSYASINSTATSLACSWAVRHPVCCFPLGELNVRDIAANIVNVIAKAIMSVLGMLRMTRH